MTDTPQATSGPRDGTIADPRRISLPGVAGRPPHALQSRIESAARAIDGDSPGSIRRDYLLEPVEHARSLASSAPELAERLSRSDLRMSAESYVRRDAEANVLRAEFEKKSRRARFAVLVATIAAALLVASAGAATIPGLPAGTLSSAVVGLSIVAVVAAALASPCSPTRPAWRSLSCSWSTSADTSSTCSAPTSIPAERITGGGWIGRSW